MARQDLRYRSNYRSTRYQSRNISNNFVKILILSIIILATIAVIASIICSIVLAPERLVKSKITNIATDYFENYYYEKLSSSPKFQQLTDKDSVLEKYHTSGLSPIPLREFFFYDNGKYQNEQNYLEKYCDKDFTTIKFYLDPPYSRTSYHYDITYSCNF